MRSCGCISPRRRRRTCRCSSSQMNVAPAPRASAPADRRRLRRAGRLARGGPGGPGGTLRGRVASLPAELDRQRPRRTEMRYVMDELMTKDVVTVTADASYREVVALMDRHRISALPVVDAAGRCVGIVT